MKLWKVAVTDARSTSIYVFLVFARAILSAARVLIAKMLPRSPRHTATESCSSQSCRKGSFKKGKGNNWGDEFPKSWQSRDLPKISGHGVQQRSGTGRERA